MKTCSRCKTTKPLNEFSIKNGRPGQKPGHRSRCKECVNEISRTIYHPIRKAGLCQPQVSETNPTYKTCIGCGLTKSIDQFHACCKEPVKAWHWDSKCIGCITAYHRQRTADGYERPEPDLANRLLEGKLKNVQGGQFKASKYTKRLKSFTLTVADIRQMITAQSINGQLKCAATGVLLDDDVRAEPLSPSLDRIDNSKGYIPGNVRIVALIYNLARRKWNDDIVLTVIQEIACAINTSLSDATVGCSTNTFPEGSL